MNAKTNQGIMVNGQWRVPALSFGSPLLDFIRKEVGLTGTKEGCREGDCGACAVLMGEKLSDGTIRYRAIPSCISALGDFEGKHLITIEGLTADSKEGLTPVMRAFLDENASQCGFCTPGFIIALTAWLAEPRTLDIAGAITAVDGNLCRCTGYGSIRRAAEKLCRDFADLPLDPKKRLAALVEREVLPKSVLAFLDGVGSMQNSPATAGIKPAESAVLIAGGTDYYVRNPYPTQQFSPVLLRTLGHLSEIREIQDQFGHHVSIGSAVTIHDFFTSKLVQQAVPGIETYETQFASTLIRNIATIGGNIANASPVGDVTAMLMGLGALLCIGVPEDSSKQEARVVPIEKFFLGYKKIDLQPQEAILAVRLSLDNAPAHPLLFSFEKIAKRKKLDIAAVNTAISFKIENGRFTSVRISAGGVAPTPILLEKTAQLLEGKLCNRGDAKGLAELAQQVSAAAESEVKPISDVRGSADYRKRMTGRLVLAHFARLFAKDGITEELFP